MRLYSTGLGRVLGFGWSFGFQIGPTCVPKYKYILHGYIDPSENLFEETVERSRVFV